MSELLLGDCQVYKPNLVIYSPIGGTLGYELNPTDEVLNKIRNTGVKLCACLWDTVGREWETWSRWLPTADGVLIIDTIIKPEYYRKDSRIIQAYSAIDPRDFYNKNLERDIDVCFIGAVDPSGVRWPGRIQYINFLKSNGINIFVAGGQRQSRISWEEYSNFLNRSKISLNWSKNPVLGTSQIKGRVFETMACRALLMEDDGDQTRKFFEPGKDYVMFHGQNDLLNKVRYYLTHDDKRQSIAQSGYEKVMKIFNSKNMWSYLFNKMGFRIPEELAKDENFLLHEKILS